MKTAAIIMAAGQSTRMNSDLPKVLHEVCGRPMLHYVVDACRSVGIAPICVVVGHRQELVRKAFTGDDNLVWVEQTERKGTAHAVLCCEPYVQPGPDAMVVIAGDMPLVRAATIEKLLSEHREKRAAVTLATTILPDPTGYGRIVRDNAGKLLKIVEHRDCTPEQLAIRECNPSYYCFDAALLFPTMKKIKPNPAKGEYYITDAVQVLQSEGRQVVAIPAMPAEEATGINSRDELALVGRLMQQRLQREWMSGGVTLVDPTSTWINSGARIGRDTIVYPFTFIDHGAVVGASCRVGPFACLMRGDQVADGEAVGGYADAGSRGPVSMHMGAVYR